LEGFQLWFRLRSRNFPAPLLSGPLDFVVPNYLDAMIRDS
jgi:hypothetical protein